MRVIFAFLALTVTIAASAQDTTWYKLHQIPGWESDKVFGGIRLVDQSNQRLVGTWLKSYTGGQTSRVAYYNFNGELTKQLDMMTIPLYYEELNSIIQFNPNQFLLSGQGANPWSNANVVSHNLMCDSLGQEIFFRWGGQVLKNCSKSSDTTFLATEYNSINNYLTHFNLHGDSLWQTTWQDLLQLSALPTPFDYRVLTILYRDSIAEVWFQENNGNNQWLSRVNLNTGQVIEAKQYQLGDLEYIVRVWNGYMYSFNTLIREAKLFYCDTSMQTFWEKTYESTYKTSIYFGIVNRSNQVMYSVVHNEYDSTHIYINKHWYTRIYTVDSLGNEVAAWQYYDVNRNYTIIPKFEFTNSNFLLSVSLYSHLTDGYGSVMMRSNEHGQVLNSDWPDYVPFPDVTVFDPYATEPLVVEETINSASGFSIFPNPTQNQVTIDFNGNTITHISIYSINGSCMKELNTKDAAHQLQVSLEDWDNGVYFMQLNGDNYSFTHKIILVK